MQWLEQLLGWGQISLLLLYKLFIVMEILVLYAGSDLAPSWRVEVGLSGGSSTSLLHLAIWDQIVDELVIYLRLDLFLEIHLLGESRWVEGSAAIWVQLEQIVRLCLRIRNLHLDFLLWGSQAPLRPSEARLDNFRSDLITTLGDLFIIVREVGRVVICGPSHVRLAHENRLDRLLIIHIYRLVTIILL